MYAPHFGLTQDPFSIAPDPRYLYMSERHREALAHLLWGMGSGGGFVLLTGEIGAGKTTVCRCFLEQVPSHCHVAYVFNPRLEPLEMLQAVCEEFGLQVPADADGRRGAKACTDALNAFLLERHAQGRQCLLIVDEAQSLSGDTLEQLRLLTNLETRERKLLQIVLIGQPELRTLLARPAHEQVAQRVIARFHLDALNEVETRLYIAHRLAVAGRSGPSPFTDAAIAVIHRRAGGIPRRINLVCDRALLGAYAHGLQQVDVAVAARAADEVFADAALTGPDMAGALPLARSLRAWWQQPWAVAAGAGAAGLVLGSAVMLWHSGPPGLGSTAREAAPTVMREDGSLVLKPARGLNEPPAPAR